MTVQFRSRIRSVFDYGKDLKKIGKCCFSDGTSEQNTFVECFNKSGKFYSDENATCPNAADLGHCCACSYLSEFDRIKISSSYPYEFNNELSQYLFLQDTANPPGIGIRSNITKCECDRIGGNWIPLAQTPNRLMCRKQVTVVVSGSPTSFTTDVRFPNACCSFILDGTQPIGVTCSNVCNARECANLNIAESGPNDLYADSVFSPNQACGTPIVPGVPAITCASSIITSRMLSGTDAFGQYDYGPCYELTQNNNVYNYECSLTNSFNCNGYWIDPIVQNKEIEYCSSKYAPKVPTVTNGFVNPIIYSQQEFDQLNLSIGDEFQGGIYIGIFKPQKSKSTGYSKVYGALNFTQPASTHISVSDESPYSKWAIIVNKSFLNTILFYSNDINVSYSSSYYDGYLNCYGEPTKRSPINSATINTITGKPRNGFIDYYIPSIIEMMFFNEQLRTNQILKNLFSMSGYFTSTTFFDDKYSVSTPTGKNTFNNLNFLYATNFSDDQNFGKSSIVNINKDVNFMLFRRLIIQ